ncbi:MAG: hypothetical protein A2020_08500 [Lentisphaerae bacterium GWF2_45_14]|nr:MAG: hypothetical protein A2020_08500 [Lentisphaerae bacterium GWF2_45_14]
MAPTAAHRSKRVYSEIWKVAYPLIITNASFTVMQFADRKFLSMSSTDDVAASMPGGILCFTLFTLFTATAGFSNAIVSQYNGAGDKAACARIPWAGVVFAVVAGLLCMAFLPFVGGAVIALGAHSPSLMMRENQYFQTLIPSEIFILLSVAFCSFFSGRGKTWYITAVHGSACAVNIVLDYILIFGKLGLPALGITGAGIATSLSCAFGALLAFGFFIFQKQSDYPTRDFRKFYFPDLKRLIKFGAPNGVEVFFSVASFTVITFLIGRLGNVQLAANTIAITINMLSFLPLLGMAEATSIVTGKYIGMNDIASAEKTANCSWKMSIVYIISTSIFYFCFPYLLFNIFRPESPAALAEFNEVMKYCPAIMFWAAMNNIFNTTRFIYLGALSGAGDTKVPMMIVIACAWGVLVPGGLTIVLVLKMSVVAVWAYLVFHHAILSGLIFMRFRSGAWKKIDLIGARQSVPMEALEPEPESPHLR